MIDWWSIPDRVIGEDDGLPRLAQGDLLRGCLWPDYSELTDLLKSGEPVSVATVEGDLIVVSQSCDLEAKKVDFVACCPVDSLRSFLSVAEDQAELSNKQKNKAEKIRKGEQYAFHLLQSPDGSADQTRCLVADFGQIISLPIDYATNYLVANPDSVRLNSPYLEHFSQAFARFFMRVGLPSTIPSFEGKAK